MKLVVGLGNPGSKYVNTRHNIGFELIDALADKYNVVLKLDKFNAEVAEIIIKNEKILLVKPLLFMNLSGEVVKRYVDYFNISLDDILIIQDDLAMELGKIRILYNRNNGGHNGIKNIENCLKSKAFTRVKIGMRVDPITDSITFVLGKFSNNEKKIINESYLKLENILEDFCNLSREDLLRKYNSKEKVI